MEGCWYAHPTDFLARLNLQDRQALYRLGSKRLFDKDAMVFHAGGSSDEVYVLLDGRVKVYELSKDGKEVILWFCFPGEVFGLAELYGGREREVNAQACSNVEVLAIKTIDLKRYIVQHPQMAMHVIELLGRRLRDLSGMLLNFASDDVTSRLVKLLTRLCSRYGKPLANGILLDIALTHQEMADMIGTSRQTVTSVLSVLRKNGVLKMEQRSIFLQDLQWIEHITGETPIPQAEAVRLAVRPNVA